MAGKRDCDAVVAMVKHSVYQALDLAALKAVLRVPVLVDGRQVFSRTTSWIYRNVGERADRA